MPRTMVAAPRVRLLSGAKVRFHSLSVAGRSNRVLLEPPKRSAKQVAMTTDLAAATGHMVKIMPVTKGGLGTCATVAFAAGDQPDVIHPPLQIATPWAETGFLDTVAAKDAIMDLGGDTVAPDPLNMAALPVSMPRPMGSRTRMLVNCADHGHHH